MHPRTFRPALCTCLLASSLLLFSTPAAVAKSIAKDDINVRSGPSTGDEILFTVPRGYPIEVERREGQWTQFRDWQNNTAWVYTPLVSDVNTAVVTADKANVRSRATLKSQVVTSAEMGEIYKVLGKKGDWVQLGSTTTTAARWAGSATTWCSANEMTSARAAHPPVAVFGGAERSAGIRSRGVRAARRPWAGARGPDNLLLTRHRRGHLTLRHLRRHQGQDRIEL